VTGWGQQRDRDRTTESGFDAHLVKPVKESDLMLALAGLDRGTMPSSAPHHG
jgi:hypothetical protein